ncbi:MAG TPA: RNA polymerase sigma factor [Anaeromyxobacteraceae bacterium]|nr:RNA polymerase sigma factor [Anaeromyxobacteraceae bacterium]
MRPIRIDDAVIERGLAGDGAALHELARALQGPFFNLARRMILDAGDAEDAVQEALLRVLTHLGQYDGRASFSTWAWRIALNACLDARARRSRLPVLSDEAFGADLLDGLDEDAPERPEDASALAEVKIGCGIAMLSTLDADHRAAYVLGDILELDGEQAAAVLGIRPAAYRKRLSRARSRIAGTLQRWCGIAREENPCRCHRRLERARSLGRVTGSPLHCAPDLPALRELVQRMEALRAAAAYYRADGELRSGRDMAAPIREWLARSVRT